TPPRRARAELPRRARPGRRRDRGPDRSGPAGRPGPDARPPGRGDRPAGGSAGASGALRGGERVRSRRAWRAHPAPLLSRRPGSPRAGPPRLDDGGDAPRAGPGVRAVDLDAPGGARSGDALRRGTGRGHLRGGRAHAVGGPARVVISSTALLVALFVLGLVVGSFLNVVIARVPHGQSIVRPGSRCPRCGHALAWYENVPLLSWVVLRARCRGCGAPISARYPAVELLTALLFLAAAWAFGWGWELLRVLLLAGFLVPLALIDLEHWIVPVGITVLGTAAGVLSAIPLGLPVVVDALAGAAAGFLVFWALERVSLLLVVKVLRPPMRRLRAAIARGRGEPPPEPEPDPTEALGAGDKWIMLLVGSYLGWRPLFGVLLLSALQGAVVGTLLLAVQGRAGSAPPPPGAPATEDGWAPEATALPYGPWLALAALGPAMKARVAAIAFLLAVLATGITWLSFQPVMLRLVEALRIASPVGTASR